MKPSEIIQPMTLEEIQQLRRLARHPDFRAKAVELVGFIRKIRDLAATHAEERRAALVDAEQALEAANRRLQDAESVLAEVWA